jgi:hypothetical protein
MVVVMWRYVTERETLWRLVIDTKYDSLRGGWCSKKVTIWSGSVEIYKEVGNNFNIC